MTGFESPNAEFEDLVESQFDQLAPWIAVGVGILGIAVVVWVLTGGKR